MKFTLEFPDPVLDELRLSEEQLLQELKQDMVVALYARGILSAGKSAEVAGIPRMAFERLLYERQVVRPYSVEDLEEDLAWARAQGGQS